MRVTEHRNHLIEGIPDKPDLRNQLLSDLRQRAQRDVPEPLAIRSILSIPVQSGISMNPILASVLIVASAAGLLLAVWLRPAATVSAAQLLSRTVNAEQSVLQGKPGVIYQRVSITTSKGRVEHEIYRDAQRRRPHRIEISEAKRIAPLRRELASVHLDLDDPLSATNYRSWHDEQSMKTDEVSQASGDLLKLVTRVPTGSIREESITVRAADFHPVARTIETVNDGTIEIAELNYAVLGWNSVNEALFNGTPLDTPATVKVTALLPSSLPNPLELDTAELGARLALHHLGADEGEQIEIRRTARSVEVHGVLDTETRKREIGRALHELPHVKPELFSVAELLRLETSSRRSPTVVSEAQGSASSLDTYLAAASGGHKQGLLNETSRDLLDAALRVHGSANELLMLQTRFASHVESATAGQALRELQQSYADRLLRGLDGETATLSRLGFAPLSQAVPERTPHGLADEVARNNALCLELVAVDSGTGRPAAEVVPEIFLSIQQVRMALAVTTSTQRTDAK